MCTRFLQLIGAAVAIRVYQRRGSPSYKLVWMCLLLILPVAGMTLCSVYGAERIRPSSLSLRAECRPIASGRAQKMLSDLQSDRPEPPQPCVGTAGRLSPEAGILAVPQSLDAAYFGEGESLLPGSGGASAAGGDLYLHGVLYFGGGDCLGRDLRRIEGTCRRRGGDPPDYRRFRYLDPSV
ncbi:MAG: PLD nuclease N-terminal domain-containing protein [Dysosmobacter sp.]